MALDNAKNFAKVTVSTGYNASATSIVLSSGNGAFLPTASFNLTWWNSTDYADPSDDPNVEIVRCTAISTDTLTVVRGQEGTSGSTKNTAGKTYKMIAGITAKVLNTDIPGLVTGVELQSNKDVASGYAGLNAGAKGNPAEFAYAAQGTQLSTPSAPSVSPQGITGATNYSYKITAKDQWGNSTTPLSTTVASSAGSTSSGNASLTGSNFNQITWTSVAGAVSYDVWRTVGGATQGWLGNVLASSPLSFNDTGLAATAWNVPTVNTTGGIASAPISTAGIDGFFSAGLLPYPLNTQAASTLPTTPTYYVFHIDRAFVVGRGTLNVTALLAASSIYSALYDANKNKVFDPGAFSGASVAQVSLSTTQITLPPGDYWFGFAASSASTLQATLITMSSALISTMNKTTARVGTGSNAVSGSALPQTIGTITSSASSSCLAVFWEP